MIMVGCCSVQREMCHILAICVKLLQQTEHRSEMNSQVFMWLFRWHSHKNSKKANIFSRFFQSVLESWTVFLATHIRTGTVIDMNVHKCLSVGMFSMLFWWSHWKMMTLNGISVGITFWNIKNGCYFREMEEIWKKLKEKWNKNGSHTGKNNNKLL